MVGMALAVGLTMRRWTRRGQDPDVLWDIVFWAVLAGIVGARAYHVLITDPMGYFGPGADPWDVLRIWEGGIGIMGAVTAGAGAEAGADPDTGSADTAPVPVVAWSTVRSCRTAKPRSAWITRSISILAPSRMPSTIRVAVNAVSSARRRPRCHLSIVRWPSWSMWIGAAGSGGDVAVTAPDSSEAHLAESARRSWNVF